MSSVLEVLQTAASEMGLSKPLSAFDDPTDLTAVQLGALYNATGEMLVKRRVWRNLFREHSVTTVANQATYPLPPDFARPISQTEWDRTNRWPMIGPETPQQWQWLRSGILSTGPRERFRLVGNTLEIWPVPTVTSTPSANLNLSFFYVSKYWAQDKDGVPKAKASVNSDTCIFEDRLMVSGVKLRFFQVKGFDTQSFAADFQANLDDALAQDGGAPILSLAREPQFPLITIYNIPDGNWSTS
jgi:hypothetical protein